MKLQYLIFTLILILCYTGCDTGNDVFEKQGPEISPLVEVNSFKQESGLIVSMGIELRALNGLDQLTVYKDGEMFEQVNYEADHLIATYDFNYEVEPVADGTIILFEFELTDQLQGQATPYNLEVEVGPPFDIVAGEIHDTPVQIITGRVNRDIILTPDQVYLINGLVSVEGDKTLTIQPGTTILMKTFEDLQESRLVITQGSRINAIGSKDEPIVFTSDNTLTGNAERGDWGGLFLYGDASVNQGATVFEEGFIYGGTSDGDNSGSLSYVRIEYAGKSDADALNLLGVGSSTQLDHIQVFKCEDNGIRLKGGTVDIKFLAVTEHAAYGLWAEHGWRGRGQFWVFQTSIAVTIIPVNYNNQARSVELRNDRNDFTLQPATYTQLSNITMIGNGKTDMDGTRRGIRVRRGAMGIVQNIIATNFPDDAVRVEDVDQERLNDETMLLGNVRSFDNKTNYEEQAETYFLPNDRFNLSVDPVTGIGPDQIVGSVSSQFDPASLSNWFDSAPFIGAIKDAVSDWTADGKWCKNPDGSVR